MRDLTLSRRAKLAIAAVVVVAIAPAAIVLADELGHDGGPGQSRVPGIASAAVHPAGSGAEALAGVAAGKASGKAKVQFFQTQGQTVPAGRSAVKVGPLPKGCRPINGYYFVKHNQRTKVISEGDSPYGTRKWAFYRDNRTGKPVKHVTYGVVCLRNVNVVH